MGVGSADTVYNLIMSRDGDEYADATMGMVIINTDADGKTGRDNAQADADTKWSETGTAVTTGHADLVDNVMYDLTFDTDQMLTIFTLKFPSTGFYAFFCQHYLNEFQGEMDSYLTDSEGNTVEFNWTSEEEPVAPWGDVILACFLVWIVTLSGLLVVALPTHLGFQDMMTTGKDGFVPTLLRYFAAGALLSLATSLILFEATHLITAGYDEEVDALWRWSVMILLGFITSPVCHVLLLAGLILSGAKGEVTQVSQKDSDLTTVEMVADGTGSQDVNKGDEAVVTATETGLPSSTNVSILAGLIFGDFFHNFADGIFIGAAFKLCDSTLAWGITAATVAHELPQEISDFIVLTNECGYSTLTAIVYNVLSGLSVIFGGIAIAAADIEDHSVGMLLAYGGGAIVYVACTELFPRGEETKLESDPLAFHKRVFGLLAFVIGTIVVSLVLLDHEHCEGGGHSH